LQTIEDEFTPPIPAYSTSALIYLTAGDSRGEILESPAVDGDSTEFTDAMVEALRTIPPPQPVHREPEM